MDIPPVDLELARRTLAVEGQTIAALAPRIGESFAGACAMVFACRGKVVLTGMGKAGIVAQKISGTLASTGTQSIYLHPADALHGDLGRLQRDDVVVALSHSGSTEEIVRLLDHIKARGAKLIAISGCDDSPLSRYADVTVCYGNIEEACPLGLAPTVSTSCMLALGDALALTVMEMRRFGPEDFAAFHPAGALGRKLLKVEDAMLKSNSDDRVCVVPDHLTLREALRQGEKSKRRTGAMLLVDASGALTGILTDADLRRAVARGGDGAVLNSPVRELMVRDPKHVHLGELASEAMALMNRHRIDELPVLDSAGKPVGMIDVQDLLGIKTITGPDAKETQ
jgi:arabinose-5-phosphate isomerase